MTNANADIQKDETVKENAIAFTHKAIAHYARCQKLIIDLEKKLTEYKQSRSEAMKKTIMTSLKKQS